MVVRFGDRGRNGDCGAGREVSSGRSLLPSSQASRSLIDQRHQSDDCESIQHRGAADRGFPIPTGCQLARRERQNEGAAYVEQSAVGDPGCNRPSLRVPEGSSLAAGLVVFEEGKRVGRPTVGLHSRGVLYREALDYRIQVDLVVRGCIWPAQEVLLLEHRLRESDFVDLARNSPIVPIGRELLYGKALFAGYDRDFVTALHILVPQIEHMVRYHLKRAGVQTTNIDSNGIENENGLSSLMDLPQTEEIFGEDMSFEIRALFCDPFGPNLRNNLAHGLLDDRACYSPDTIYAWWFGLKLVFNTFWNALSSDAESKEQGGE